MIASSSVSSTPSTAVVSYANAVLGDFNGARSGKILLILDEAYWADDGKRDVVLPVPGYHRVRGVLVNQEGHGRHRVQGSRWTEGRNDWWYGP